VIAARVAAKSQMRPFEQIFRIRVSQPERTATAHLLPKDATHGDHTVCFTVRADQADDHQDK
jgi:hypothetical protein